MRQRRPSLLVLLVIGGGLILSIVIVSRLASLNAVSKLKGSNDNVVQSSQSLILANSLEQRVLDLETGLRGYLLTGEPRFLAPRSAALSVIPSLERRLQAAEPEPDEADRAALGKLYARIHYYAYVYQPGVLALAKRDLERARDVHITSEGKHLVDQMRAIFATFVVARQLDEQQRRSAASDSVASAETIALIGLIAVPVLIVIWLVWTAISVVAPVRRLANAAERIREGDFEARVTEGGAGEVRDLAVGFNAMAASLQRSRDELETQNAELEAQRHELESTIDELAVEKARSERAATLNQAVLDTANDAYLATDEHGRLVEWAPRAEQMFGWSREEALGKAVEELTMAPEVRRFFAIAREQLIEAGKRGDPRRFETTATSRDGRRFIVEVSAAAIRSRTGWTLSAFVRDIDQRVRHSREREATEAVSRALAEAQAGEEVLLKVIDALTEAMDWRGGSLWEWDEQARCLRCAHVSDRGDERLATAGELARGTALDADASLRNVDLQALESGEVTWARLSDDSEDERTQSLLAAGVRATITLPLRRRGEAPLGALRFVLDSEERPPDGELEAFASIADLVSEVVGRRAAEREAERLKSEFFALVSHELRTPLTSIIGYLEIVREEEAGELNERQARCLGVIDRNARRLMRLVGDLLFVAQVEAGTLSLERGDVDVGTVAVEAVEAARPRAEGKGILLTIDAAPLQLHGADRDRLGQLIDNLLTNALNFTDEGGRIGARVCEADGIARIEVSDTGIGIAQEELERLFERFYRAEAATEAAVPGIGLGLSICKAIAEGHGGSISVSSELGKGTTFRVELPTGDLSSLEMTAARGEDRGRSESERRFG